MGRYLRRMIILLAAQQIMLAMLVNLSTVASTNLIATLTALDGRTIQFSGTKSQDLRRENFDNCTVSANVSGIWILYEDYNYYGEAQLMTSFYPGYNTLKVEFGLKVSSIRYAGSSFNDFEDTLTLYQGIGYRGEDVVLTDTQGNIDWNPSSLVVTGRDPWTFFPTPNFDGAYGSVCIFPPGFYDTHELKLINNSIGSVLRGCVGQS